MIKGRWAGAGLIASVGSFVFLVGGCLPASTFTTARPLARGQTQHVASVDAWLGQFDHDESAVGDVEAEPFVTGGASPGYGVRHGLTDALELGGSFSLGALEANGKVAFLELPHVALALAPRVTVAWSIASGSTSAYQARLPLLVTWEATSWLDLTPRVGAGIINGLVSDEALFARRSLSIAEPIGEVGLAILFRTSSSFGIALEAQGLASPPDRMRTVVSGGAGLGFVWGLPRQGTRR